MCCEARSTPGNLCLVNIGRNRRRLVDSTSLIRRPLLPSRRIDRLQEIWWCYRKRRCFHHLSRSYHLDWVAARSVRVGQPLMDEQVKIGKKLDVRRPHAIRGARWVHLRICRSCGHVGCCEQSPGKHATKHFQASRHPIIEGYDPPEGWGWCYVDETFIELDHPTQQLGPIPRFAP